jgi:hypothetical protein
MVFIHVAATLVFMLAHGVSVTVAFALPQEPNLERVRGLLSLSGKSYRGVYLSLYALLISGIITGVMGNWWSKGWFWLSIILLVAIVIGMGILGGAVYGRARQAAGLPYHVRGKPMPAEAPLSEAEIRAILAQGRPLHLALVGYGGILVILWLMMFKPF